MAYPRPAIPADESERLAELRDLDILDTEAEEVFDGLVRLAAFVCDTPIALFSLIDAERQWFKSRVGLAATETPREMAFCAHAIHQSEQLFVVPDANKDARFRDNPLVTGDPNIRFYAGMPIKTRQGSAIGTLCVLDQVPHDLSDVQCKSLTTLAQAVSTQLKLRRELSIANNYDAVTGLPNSLSFEKKFRAITPHIRRGCLLLASMERLNKIAAAYGSSATDAILKQATQRLEANAQGGALLAFFKRGLFVLFLPGADPAEFSRFATQRLAQELAVPYEIGDHKVGCPVHMGASFFPNDGTAMDALLIAAEQALESARKLDEPFLFYTRDVDDHAGEQLRLEPELRKALDRGEFVNYYQPKIDLATGKLVGAEALMRWMHPERGLVSPAHFIPALEASGLILAAGQQVLVRAVADWCQWRDAGLSAPRIAVNVTAAQLKSKNFIHDIKAALTVNGGESAILSMEVTESTLMADPQQVSKVLGALRNLGIPIAIDDFGTGYSSLAYLVTLPIDELKIDRAFVIKMTTDPAYLGLVNTIISLAHNLNLKVVAEGIETEEQAKLLRLLKCEEAQGYLYSPPIPAEHFSALLVSR